MSSESDNQEISYNSERMHNIDPLCDNLNARCSGYYSAKMYKWNNSGRNEPLTFQCKLSYPNKTFIFERKTHSVATTESTSKHLTDALAVYSRGNHSLSADAKYRVASESIEQNREMQSMNSRIDGAKQFLAQSGILGTTNFTSSCDLIRKTSSIHIDATLREQIRKTSMCLRSRIFIEKNIPKGYDELINSLQHEVDTLKGIIDNGETKIITLRTEIGKLKRALQEIMHVQMVTCSNAGDGSPSPKGTTICLFCQPRSWTSKN
ncbi:uncharacterized protein LOC111070749 isoform X2 [Drosophila obscura]|nr:uncharacterized protein LOC111070749 isoform X2 [Drosophila obscura]